MLLKTRADGVRTDVAPGTIAAAKFNPGRLLAASVGANGLGFGLSHPSLYRLPTAASNIAINKRLILN
jgi:hypothetical protein